jgi:hypothetical protein
MNAQLIRYRKAQLAKWLFGITLIISLFAFSAPTAASNRLPQKTTSELLYANKQRTPARSVQFAVRIPNPVSAVLAADHSLSLLAVHHSTGIQFNTLALQYAMARQRIQSPDITFIFNHSGQKNS